jgi:hypothetical protein
MSEIKNSNGVITLTSSFINLESTGVSGVNIETLNTINLDAAIIDFNNIASLTNITTDALTEGVSNLYFSGKTTDELDEGISNLYFSGKTTDELAEGVSNLYFSGKTTDELDEGISNLYFTSSRGISAIENASIITFDPINSILLTHISDAIGNSFTIEESGLADMVIQASGATNNLILQSINGNVDISSNIFTVDAGPVYSIQGLTSSGDISLNKLVTTFDTTTGGITATLGDGINGQMKVLTLINDTNTVSLSSPGITALGFTSITLDTLGSCATLLYTENGWVIVNERNARIL